MTKRNQEEISIGEALKEFIETNKLEKGLDRVNVAEAWSNLMGKGVNHYTTQVQLQGSTLHIQLSSSVLREELSYGKEKIIAMINEALGKTVIDKIVLR